MVWFWWRIFWETPKWIMDVDQIDKFSIEHDMSECPVGWYLALQCFIFQFLRLGVFRIVFRLLYQAKSYQL